MKKKCMHTWKVTEKIVTAIAQEAETVGAKYMYILTNYYSLQRHDAGDFDWFNISNRRNISHRRV